MKIRMVEKVRTFIPKFNGNKDVPENEQITIDIKNFPTATETSLYKSFAYGTNGTVELKFNDAIMLPNCVGRIKNLIITDSTGTSEKEIINGAELAKADSGLAPLITEIRDYVFSSGEILQPGELKN